MKINRVLVLGVAMFVGLVVNLQAFGLIWGNRPSGFDDQTIWDECYPSQQGNIDDQQEMGECECEQFDLYWYDDECHTSPGG
jgi:hypothetical protein